MATARRLAGVWLVADHRAAHPTTAGTAGEVVRRVRLRLPYREGIVFGVLAAVAVGVAVAGPKRVMLTLGELVPTSGGTGETDPFARYGVGDGPEEVAGDNARSAGLVESDTVIENNKDALVDVASDMFGPPHKPRKDQEKMVAGGLADVIRNYGQLPAGGRVTGTSRGQRPHAGAALPPTHAPPRRASATWAMACAEMGKLPRKFLGRAGWPQCVASLTFSETCAGRHAGQSRPQLEYGIARRSLGTLRV